MSFPAELLSPRRAQRLPDELRRIEQRGIIRAYLHLRDDRGDVARRAHAAQRILQRLLNHVSDPAGRSGHEHAERKWSGLATRDLVANQLVPDLRSVAVHHTHVPAVVREIHDGTKALTRVTELIVNGASFAGRSEGIAAQRDDRRGNGRRAHRIRTRKLDRPAMPGKLTAADCAVRRRVRQTPGQTRSSRRATTHPASPDTGCRLAHGLSVPRRSRFRAPAARRPLPWPG